MTVSGPTDEILRDAEARLASDDPVTALAAFERWARVFEDADDPRAVALDIAVAHALKECGRLDEAREFGNRAVAAARRLEEPVLLGRALGAVAEALYRAGGARAAEALARRALAEAPDDPPSRANAALVLALVHRDRGVLEDALRWSDAASNPDAGRVAVRAAIVGAELRRLKGDHAGARAVIDEALGRCDPGARIDRALLLHGHAAVTLETGDPRGALEQVEALRALLEGVTAQASGAVANLRGEILRRLGDLPGASRAYREAMDAFAAVSHRERWTAALNLVLTCLLDDRTAEAEALLEEAAAADGVGDQAIVGTFVELLVAAVAAGKGDREAWGRHHERAAARLVATPVTDPDLATALRLAGQAWAGSADRADRSRAFRARALALAQWERLMNPAEIATEHRALRALSRAGVPVPAGPFDLLEEIGHGAMGEVFRARHHVRGTEVAVKLLRTDATQDDAIRSHFDAEIRAVAALDHPGIVRILGHGVLDGSAAVAGGPHHAGAPWFAMELVPGGTLRDVCGRLRWSQCRMVLATLLDALAHAHARDVLHLDLKPANVLLDTAGDTIRIRLADFGLAGLVGGADKAMGTPPYMAPEQFRAYSRDLGPPSDLYALGCVAYHLLCGRPPFEGDDPSALRLAHLGQQPPALRPVVPVAEGFAGWVGRLLEKDAADRFVDAADAAWALYRLADPADDPAPSGAADVPAAPASPQTFTLPTWDSLVEEDVVSPPTGEQRGERPPMPVRWRSPTPPRPAGVQALDLFGLRRIPIVGRVQERSLLWATLSDVYRRARPRLLAIEGPSGSGRTALARWLVETARERGVASVLTTRCGSDGAGLAALVTRWFRTEDLPADLVKRRIEHLCPTALSVQDRAALVALAGGKLDPDDAVAPVAHLVAALAQRRPTILWLEGEPALDPSAVALARELVSGTAPVLVVLEALPGQDREADRRYEDLLDLPPTMAVTLEPLTAEEVRELVLDLLPLDLETVDQIVSRASGDLHLAVVILGDLVDRDALLEGPRGLVLRPGTRLAPPARLEAGWAERLERALDGLPPVSRDVLGACAICGGEIPADAWKAICDASGLVSPSQLLRQLRTHRLITPTASRGWSFAHRGLAQLLRDQAAADGRLPRLSALAARFLPFPDPARLGTVLLDAGDPENAIAPLSQGLQEALDRLDPTASAALVDGLDDALRTLGVSEADPRWVRSILGRARLADLRGDRDEALRLADRALEMSEGADRAPDRFEALWVAARARANHGQGAKATDTLKQALAVARELDDPQRVANVRLAVANGARLRGDLEGAERHYERGLAELGDAVDAATRAALTMGLGLVRAARGDLDSADDTLRNALAGLDGAGDWRLAADCRAALGRLACSRGELEAAESWFDAALAQILHSDRSRRADVKLDRCLVYATQGRWEEVGAQVREILDGTPDLHVDAKAWAFTLLAAAEVAAPDATWAVAVDTLDSLLRQTGLCRVEVARILESAASRATEPARARRCYELAAAQWRTLGDRDAAKRTRDLARGT